MFSLLSPHAAGASWHATSFMVAVLAFVLAADAHPGVDLLFGLGFRVLGL